MEYCVCGSIKVNSKCTNRNCQYGMRLMQGATYGQIECIESLYKQLNITDAIDYTMGKYKAHALIGELLEQVSAKARES